MSDLFDLSGLWLQERGGGSKYLVGTANAQAMREFLVRIPDDVAVKFFVFPNKKRATDRQPTHRLKFSILEPEGGQQPATRTDNGPRQADRPRQGDQNHGGGGRTGNATARPGSGEDDLPF